MAAPSQGSAASVPQAIPFEQFLKCLADSGLMPADEVMALRDSAAAQAKDTRSLAQELIQQGKLTRYQATMLCQGKTKGLVLGNYVVLDKLGQGGMGMVFKAQHRRMKREVALKVLSPKITSNPTAVQRFQREVEAVARLSHPNIVAAHDADEDRGVHFLVMEFVDGADLAGLVRKQGPLPVGQAVEAILQAAHGLAHAHQEGIVHRDIKPHNLLLSRRATKLTGSSPSTPGQPFVVKILDMGLARMDGTPGNAPAAELTESGSIMGTCDYMAPEQALNTKRADHRADIYSLGCTLYFVLTGKVMYKGETAMEKLMAHQQDPIPSLRKRRPEVPAELENIYQRMVAKKVDDRYQSIAELVTDLEACLGKCSAITAKVNLDETRVVGVDDGDDFDADSETRTEYPGDDSSRTKLLESERVPSAQRKWLIAAGVGGLVLVVAVVLFFMLGGPRQSDGTDRANTSPPGSEAAWLKEVQSKPAAEQVDAVVAQLRERNPGYAGFVGKNIVDGVVTEFAMNTDKVKDISPLRALGGLTHLNISGSAAQKGQLEDLSPLRGLPLTHLMINNTRVRNLSPLQGMQLVELQAERTQVSNLSPLEGMPLVKLNLADTPVNDLSPLRGLPLQELSCPIGPGDLRIIRQIKSLRVVNGKLVPEFLKRFGPLPKGFDPD